MKLHLSQCIVIIFELGGMAPTQTKRPLPGWVAHRSWATSKSLPDGMVCIRHFVHQFTNLLGLFLAPHSLCRWCACMIGMSFGIPRQFFVRIRHKQLFSSLEGSIVVAMLLKVIRLKAIRLKVIRLKVILLFSALSVTAIPFRRNGYFYSSTMYLVRQYIQRFNTEAPVELFLGDFVIPQYCEPHTNILIVPVSEEVGILLCKKHVFLRFIIRPTV